MTKLSQIHWYEGLFIRPHHLQSMQRHLLERVSSDRQLAWPFPYGIVDAQLSNDALENSRIHFDKLRAVMPSGLEIDVPEQDDLPALDIKNAFATTSGSFSIYLGVALWSAHRSNTIDGSGDDDYRTKKIFRVSEIQRADENTGENPQPVLVRRVNARLLLEDDDRSDMEVLPLLRIARSTVEGTDMPMMDPDYVPPCLVLKGSQKLFELVRDLANQIEASRASLMKRLRPGFTMEDIKGNKLRQMFKLQTLSRFSARLSQLTAIPVLPPFTFDLEMRDLLGELEALHPDREHLEVAEYDHDNPLLGFEELSRAIRSFLAEAPAEGFRKLPLVRNEKKFVVELNPDEFAKPFEYYLLITNGGEFTEVAKLVTDASKFKLMPDSKIRTPIPGIPMEEARVPPESFPTRAGYQYFRLLPSKNPMIWKRISEEGVMAITWEGMEDSTMDITLYMALEGQ